MSKHTPGPWKARMQYSRGGRELGWMVEHSNGRIGWASLAYADTNEEAPVADPVNAANARLIAAAPDLLEALRKCDEAMTWETGGEPLDTMLIAARDAARAALAKTQGEMK